MYFILDFPFWVKSLRIVRSRILWWLWCSVTHKSRGTGTGRRLPKESHLPTVPYCRVESVRFQDQCRVVCDCLVSEFNLIEQGRERVLWMGLSLVFFL